MEAEALAKWMRAKALQKDGYAILTDKDRIDITQELKQLYFHAGRASAGARDYLAVEAYKRYQSMERR